MGRPWIRCQQFNTWGPMVYVTHSIKRNDNGTFAVVGIPTAEMAPCIVSVELGHEHLMDPHDS